MSAPLPSTPPSASRLALWVSLYGVFVSNITLTILVVALPYISRDLKASPSTASWVTLGPMLVVALCTPASGRAADALGRKRVWIFGFALSLVGMLACALAPSIGPLLLARVVTGVGTALLLPSALAICTDLYPPEERATPIGYWTSAMAISPLLGVLLGGALLDLISWRWLFMGQVLLGVPALAAAVWGFEERRFAVKGRFDVEGSLAIGLASLALTLAASWLGDAETRATRTPVAALCALLCAGWAVTAERRADQPVLPPSLLAEPVVFLGLISRVTLTFSYMGAFMTLPYLLKELWHLSALTISGLLIWRPLAMGVTGPLAGRLTSRFGAARLVVWGGYCILGASAAFMLLGAQPNRALLVLGLTVAGVGLGLCAPGSVAVVTERVGSNLLGTVSALMTLTATLSNALGMAVMFAVVEGFGGVSDPDAYRASFATGTLMAALGVLAAHALQARSSHPNHATGGTLPAP
jgi:DHA2 family methylenomycin A resistance protein-like MFS transporter